MEQGTAKALKFGGIILGGGIAAGLVLAMATPTAMKNDGSDPLGAIPAHAIAETDVITIPIEAPPQDLTPVRWDLVPTAPYAAANTGDWVTPVGYNGTEADFTSEQELPESLPEAILAERDTELASIGSDDAAASSAEAAQAAAAAVQAEESAAISSDEAVSPVNGAHTAVLID